VIGIGIGIGIDVGSSTDLETRTGLVEPVELIADASLDAAPTTHDPARVAREFAAIMTRAGFGDRVVAAAIAPRPRGLESGESPFGPTVHANAAVTTMDSRHRARVRSPPVLRCSGVPVPRRAGRP
jgi:hypothetical protein